MKEIIVKRRCKTCEFLNGLRCEKFDYDLTWSVAKNGCEGYESIDKEDKVKPECQNCVFFDGGRCKRYTPFNKEFPIVDGIGWCGEFQGKVK